jgi:soluble lytic murein transglycosylase-like protein
MFPSALGARSGAGSPGARGAGCAIGLAVGCTIGRGAARGVGLGVATAVALGLALAAAGGAQAQLARAAAMPQAAAAQLPAASPDSASAAAALLETLPRPNAPPPEKGPVVPAQVQRWRQEAHAAEHGEGMPRDALRAAELYCRAARYGDAEAQFSLAWMLTNARGIERNDAQAAHLFAAAAEQGHPQAVNMASRLGTPMGPPPPCLRAPEADLVAQAPVRAAPPATPRPGGALPPPLPIPANAPAPIVNFVRLVAPEYRLDPGLVLAVIAAESNFDPGAVSPKNAQGLMQLIPDTARRFGVRNPLDPAQNIRGGMAYLRWLLAYFEGDVSLALAAYNAGEGAVERYLGVPPFAETRNYVLKILVALNGRRSHPFDAGAAAPSSRLALMRDFWQVR